MDKKLNAQLQNSIKKRRIYISGNMVSDPDFDINNYITDVQKQVELEKIIVNFKKSLPNIYNTISNNKKERKPLATLSNLLTLSKDNIFNNKDIMSNRKNQKILNTDLSTQKKLYEMNNDIQLIKKKIAKMVKNQQKSSKSSTSIVRKRIGLSNEPKINIIRTLRNIKKKGKSFSQRNLIKKNRKIFEKQIKTIENNNNNINNNDIYANELINNQYYNDIIPFNKKHENLVYEPLKIINEYHRQKGIENTYQEKCLSNFKTQNKEVSINNVLIKLMNSETNKLSENCLLRNESLKNGKKALEKNELKFEDYKNSHRIACKQIDNLYINIQKKSKELIEKNCNCRSDIKTIHEDMRRELLLIDNLRSYGYFINYALGGDTTRFETKIFPEENYEFELDIEALTKSVIKKYRCFLDKTEEEKFFIEKSFIDEPEKMWFKFKEIEGIIIRNIYAKENINDETEKIKEDNKNNLKDLIQKHEMLINEYEIFNEQYKYEISKYNKIEKIYNYHKSEYDDLIKNFYIFIKNIFNDNNSNNNNKIYDDLDALDCVKEIYNIICDKEIIIDKLIIDLKRYQKNDHKIIEEVVYNRKKENHYKKKYELKCNKKIKFRNNSDSSKNRYIIQSRKTEAPYHKPKKIIKEKVDEKIEEQIENEQLMNYEEE